MKHPADMTLDELITLKSNLEQMTAMFDGNLRKSISHFDEICNRIAMKIGFPLVQNGEWHQEWIEERILDEDLKPF